MHLIEDIICLEFELIIYNSQQIKEIPINEYVRHRGNFGKPYKNLWYQPNAKCFELNKTELAGEPTSMPLKLLIL